MGEAVLEDGDGGRGRVDRPRRLGVEPRGHHGQGQGDREGIGEGEEGVEGRIGPAGVIVAPPERGGAPLGPPGVELGREGTPLRLVPDPGHPKPPTTPP